MDKELAQLERASQADPDNAELWLRCQLHHVRSHGVVVYWDWIGNRMGWNHVAHVLQDQVIAYVASQLGEAYRFTETETFACAGVSHRLGVFTHVKTGMEMVLVPGGTYMMGGDERVWEKPIHKVTIKPMLVGRYPVTQKQWETIGDNDGRNWKGLNLPIESVSWNDCKAWLDKAGDGLRLLSESEWEYACRAGSTTEFCFGDTITTDQVNYNGNFPFKGSPKGTYRQKTVSVGSLPGNAFGLHEMHGNVSEWCEDGWVNNYNDGPNNHLPRNTIGPSYRVRRGGSWLSYAENCRSASHGGDTPDFRDDNLGFRVSRSLNG